MERNPEADRRILLTGASGFIGRGVQKLLHRSGYDVLPIDVVVMPTTGEGSFGLGRAIPLDITDSEKLKKLVEAEPIAGIVHLAAILPTAAQRDPVRTTAVNVQASLNLLEMARQSGVRRFVFGSSLSIYGSYPADHVVAETDRAAPTDLYGAAKLYVEQVGQAYRDLHGLEFVCLRIGRVVGKGAKSTTSAWRSEIFEFLQAKDTAQISLPYEGSERVLLIHVDDAAQMIVTLLHAPRLQHAIYNAPCESIMVEELKRKVESLNPNIRMMLGDAKAVGNPRRLDASRFEREFGMMTEPIFNRLARAAQGRHDESSGPAH